MAAATPIREPGIPLITLCLARIKAGRHIATLKVIRRNESGSGTDWSADVTLKNGDSDVLRGDGRLVLLPQNLKPGDVVRLSVNDQSRVATWGPFDPEKDAELLTQKVRKKRPRVDADLLMSLEGLPAVVSMFPKISFKGSGYETQDLHTLMHFYRQWAFNLFPKLHFHAFLGRVEQLSGTGQLRMALGTLRDEIIHPERSRSRAAAQAVQDSDGLDSDSESDGGAYVQNFMPELIQRAPARSSGRKKKRLKRIGGGHSDDDRPEEDEDLLAGLDLLMPEDLDALFESIEFPPVAEVFASESAEPVAKTAEPAAEPKPAASAAAATPTDSPQRE